MRKILSGIIPYIIKALPETRFYGAKRSLYRYLGCQIGENTRICSSAKIYCLGKVVIGKEVWIGQEAFISSAPGGEIIIEDYARIGIRSIVVNGFHELDPHGNCIIGGKSITDRVVIKKGCSVGTSCIILPGKTVGSMAHVAAGSVVTKDVPDFTRVAGVPAVVKKNLLEEKVVNKN